MTTVAPIFRATVDTRGELQFAPSVRGLLRVYLLKLVDKPVEVSVKPWRAKRSTQANRYYFGVVVPLLAEHCGYDRQEMHELLAMRFLRIEDDPVTGSPRRKHTPETDSQEFAAYVNDCLRLGAELGVYIPSPHEVA